MSTKWGAEDYEKAAELCERTGSLNDADGAYADMLRHTAAALAAAAERETKLREENERLRREADCHVSAESALETLARAETAQAEVERLNGELDKLAITLSHEAHARAAERQKVEKLFTWVIEKERQYNLNRGGFITATAVFRQMISLGFIVPGFGLTPDPPREK